MSRRAPGGILRNGNRRPKMLQEKDTGQGIGSSRDPNRRLGEVAGETIADVGQEALLMCLMGLPPRGLATRTRWVSITTSITTSVAAAAAAAAAERRRSATVALAI